MKMKQLLVFLCLLGLVQVVFLAAGAALINELVQTSANVKLMIIWAVLTACFGMIGTALYFKLFLGTSKSNHK